VNWRKLAELLNSPRLEATCTALRIPLRYRFYDYLGREEGEYVAVGVIETPNPRALGFKVGNPREFGMLSADTIAVSPFKVLGKR